MTDLERMRKLAGITGDIDLRENHIALVESVDNHDKIDVLMKMNMCDFDYTKISEGKGPSYLKEATNNFCQSSKAIISVIHESSGNTIMLFMKNKNNGAWLDNARHYEVNCQLVECEELLNNIMRSYDAKNYTIKLLTE